MPLSFPSITPEDAARQGFLEFCGTSIGDFNVELECLTHQRTRDTPRYREFHNFLKQFLPVDESTITGFSLHDLSPAQKWLLLFAIDIFFDYFVITCESFEQWLEVWRGITGRILPGYDLISQMPETIDPVKLDAVWTRFRAAVS